MPCPGILPEPGSGQCLSPLSLESVHTTAGDWGTTEATQLPTSQTLYKVTHGDLWQMAQMHKSFHLVESLNISRTAKSCLQIYKRIIVCGRTRRPGESGELKFF